MKFLQTQFNHDETFHLFNSNKPHIFPLLLNVVVLYEPVRRAFCYGQLDSGKKSGFYADTVSDFIRNISNGIQISPPILFIFQIILTLFVLIPFFIFVRKFAKKEKSFFDEYQGFVVTNLLLLIISFIIILHHQILGADYPTGRFSVFLFPIFIIYFGFFIDFMLAGSLRKAALTFTSVIALIGIISFVTRSNSFSFGVWAYDAETKNMIHALKTYRKMNDDNSKSIKLGINWLFEPTINFYRKTEKLDWLLEVDRKGLTEDDDYIYTFENSIIPLDSSKHEIIKKYEDTKTILIRVKTVSNKKCTS